jgi:hypothetical protein
MDRESGVRIDCSDAAESLAQESGRRKELPRPRGNLRLDVVDPADLRADAVGGQIAAGALAHQSRPDLLLECPRLRRRAGVDAVEDDWPKRIAVGCDRHDAGADRAQADPLQLADRLREAFADLAKDLA